MVRKLLVLCFTSAVILYAQDSINENELFGDANAVMVDSARFSQPAVSAQNTDQAAATQRGIKASGEVAASANLGYSRTALHDVFHGQATAPTLQNTTIGTLFLDARAQDDTKAFAAIEGDYLSDSSLTRAYLRELFVDFNLLQHVYIRAGKQVLQWGRCYFWNPSDLINVEHKAFVQRQGSLDGTYGLRMHIPVGTAANFYGFIDTKNATSADEVKVAAKAEVLLGTTETALSIWNRKGLDPVYSWDISSSIKRWDLAGELALFPKGFATRYQIRDDSIIATPSSAFTPRAALSLGRFFNFLDVNDRIRIQYEMYYNGLGYTKNPLEDPKSYPWNTVSQLSPEQTGLPTTTVLQQGPKALWLFANDQIAAYSLGRYYAAFFASMSQFIVPDLTISCNGLMNATDRSYTLSTSLAYTTLQSLTLQITAVSMGGPLPAEFTYSQQRMLVIGSIRYSF